METLTALLEQEGRNRDLIAAGETVTPESAFALVRDMPYQRAGSRRPESIIEEWRGTCSGKRYALDRIFREMGMDSRVIMCIHRFTRDNTGHSPADLRALVAREPVPDVHTYIRVESPQGWMSVDATWPSSAGPLGMLVNQVFNRGKDMTIAGDPIETRAVPAGRDPHPFKEQLIQGAVDRRLLRCVQPGSRRFHRRHEPLAERGHSIITTAQSQAVSPCRIDG